MQSSYLNHTYIIFSWSLTQISEVHRMLLIFVHDMDYTRMIWKHNELRIVTEFWKMDLNHTFMFSFISYCHMNSTTFSTIIISFSVHVWNSYVV